MRISDWSSDVCSSDLRNVVLAINKMDLVGYSQERFDEIVADYTAFAEGIGLKNFLPVPISGLKGDNITLRSDNPPWYNGPVLLDHLETVELDTERLAQHQFRMDGHWRTWPNRDQIGKGTGREKV